MSTCTKELELVVEGGLRVWYPLEATGAQVDVLSGIVASESNPGSSTFSAPAGKVLNGALITKAAFDVNVGFDTGIIGALAYDAADGFTLCGWARRVTGSANQILSCSLALYADAGGVTLNGLLDLSDGVNICQVGTSGTPFSICNTNVAHVVGLGTFFFFVASYRPSDGKALFQIDNGPVQTSACSVIIPSSPFGRFRLIYGGINPAGEGQFDEVALFYPMLTQPQIDYIWNGGLGRTPPITLP